MTTETETLTFSKRANGGYFVARASGLIIGRVEKVNVDNSNARARMYSRMEWKATTRSGRKLAGTFETRNEAAAAIAAVVTVR